MNKPVVAVETGKLLGKVGEAQSGKPFFSFQGIPYAKPPIGTLRFKAPQPPEPWQGIKDATEEGGECYAKHPVLKDVMVGSEDCLVLNVYTPNIPQSNNANELKPVMVWIHGGGFTNGSGSSQIYGPEFLLTEDVVLVTINYRTGVLGFLSLENQNLNVPGNAGLKDMVMALKWVQRNIRNFLGDPNNVTIFGESAGGAAVHYLILSPLAKGLFHKAILQSGCALNLWARGKQCAKEIAQNLGFHGSNETEILRLLQKVTVEDLYKASLKVPDQFVITTKRPFGPVIESPSKDAFITQEPIDIIKSGNYNKCSMIIGYTSREGMLSEVLQKPKKVKPITDFRQSIPYFLHIKDDPDKSNMVAKSIKEFYYGNEEPTIQNLDKFYLLESDNFFIRELFRAIEYHLETSSTPIYLYRMSVETKLNMLKILNDIKAPGVCHADDIGYLFKNLLTPEISSGSKEDVAVKRIVAFWTNFAKYGNPNPKVRNPLIGVNWKPTSTKELNYIDIGKELNTGVNPEKERLAFWKEILKVNPIHKL